jgi:hypothetical protein
MNPVRCTQCHQAVHVVLDAGLACGCTTFPRDLLATLLLALAALPAPWPLEDVVTWLWEAVQEH